MFNLFLASIDDIRIPRWPWDECALSHECEANAGKLAVKIQQMYGKLWLVWRKRKKILKTGRFQSLNISADPRNICLQQKKEELVELTEKAHELALELTDDSEPINDVEYAKLVTKDGTIPNPYNLHSD